VIFTDEDRQNLERTIREIHQMIGEPWWINDLYTQMTPWSPSAIGRETGA